MMQASRVPCYYRSSHSNKFIYNGLITPAPYIGSGVIYFHITDLDQETAGKYRAS